MAGPPSMKRKITLLAVAAKCLAVGSKPDEWTGPRQWRRETRGRKGQELQTRAGLHQPLAARRWDDCVSALFRRVSRPWSIAVSLIYIQEFIGIQKNMAEVDKRIATGLFVRSLGGGRAMACLPLDKRNGIGDFVGRRSAAERQAVRPHDSVAVVSREWLESLDSGGEGFGPCQRPVAIDQEQGLRGRGGRVAPRGRRIAIGSIKRLKKLNHVRCGRLA